MRNRRFYEWESAELLELAIYLKNFNNKIRKMVLASRKTLCYNN